MRCGGQVRAKPRRVYYNRLAPSSETYHDNHGSRARSHHLALPQTGARLDYARLDYNPDEPVLKPEAMEQEQPMQEIIGLLASRFH